MMAGVLAAILNNEAGATTPRMAEWEVERSQDIGGLRAVETIGPYSK